jgi:hypothetical protein
VTTAPALACGGEPSATAKLALGENVLTLSISGLPEKIKTHHQSTLNCNMFSLHGLNFTWNTNAYNIILIELSSKYTYKGSKICQQCHCLDYPYRSTTKAETEMKPYVLDALLTDAILILGDEKL